MFATDTCDVDVACGRIQVCRQKDRIREPAFHLIYQQDLDSLERVLKAKLTIAPVLSELNQDSPLFPFTITMMHWSTPGAPPTTKLSEMANRPVALSWSYRGQLAVSDIAFLTLRKITTVALSGGT